MKQFLSFLLVFCLFSMPIFALSEETVIQYDSVVSDLVSDLSAQIESTQYRAYFSAVMVMDSTVLKDHGVSLATKELSYVACREGYQAVCFASPEDAGVYYLLEHNIAENTATCTILEGYDAEKIELLFSETYQDNWRVNEPGTVPRLLMTALRDVAGLKGK